MINTFDDDELSHTHTNQVHILNVFFFVFFLVTFFNLFSL